MRSTITLVRTIPSRGDTRARWMIIRAIYYDRVPRKLQDREGDDPQTASRQRTSCIGNVVDVAISSQCARMTLIFNISHVMNLTFCHVNEKVEIQCYH